MNYSFAPHQQRPDRFSRTIGKLGALQGLNAQQDESAFMREKIAQMQQQTEHGATAGPLDNQLNQQKLQQLMFQNSPEQQDLQSQTMRGIAQRYDPFPEILQALSYSGDQEAIRYLLQQKGLLGSDFGQQQPSAEDIALRNSIQQRLSMKGAR